MVKKTFNNDRGFTLIEIIASIALLALVIMVLLPIFPQIFKWTGKTENELTASNLVGQVAYDVKNDRVEDWYPTPVKECKGEEKGISYKTYTLNNINYQSTIGLCKEAPVNLYRAEIKVYGENNNLISESYTYIKSEEKP
ncbi:type II secretion system protein [Oceanobacillus picturae]|uniref:type II secretion system protein n=1 Tax=Oceanobacillus picturae TaxID=171693 RepID=UPI000E68CD27|nr:prepilin-type N-terminal cleavage/methylation domain-containing protein [Oceanobacillus picturae]RIU89720.1 type II secretion system protein [Oceanobacillus picturae]